MEENAVAETITDLRSKVARVATSALARPTGNSTIDVLVRRAARADAHMQELARAAQAKGRDNYAASVAASADALWVSVEFVIAEATAKRVVCARCAGSIHTVTDAVARWSDDDTREIVHATGRRCGSWRDRMDKLADEYTARAESIATATTAQPITTLRLAA